MAEGHKSSETELLFALLWQRFGARLTPGVLEEVRRGVEGMVQAAEALRAIELGNSDEPYALFVPYCRED